MIDVGSGPGYIARHLDRDMADQLIMIDSSGIHY